MLYLLQKRGDTLVSKLENPQPFSMRVCLGGRYFFTENYGLVGEIGLGGALVRAGLSIKF